jgi:uncharacterized protein (TIGR03435 family)
MKLFLMGAISIIACAQVSEPLKFEVASIRRGDLETNGGPSGFMPGGGYRSVNYPLRNVLSYALHLDISRLSIKTDWVISERYVIEAKALDPTANEDQVRAMILALLEERCRLKYHREAVETPVYVLSVDKKGPHLKDSTETRTGPIAIGRESIDAKNTPMVLLTTALTRMLGRVVVDETALTGKYDFSLHFDPSSAAMAMPPRENVPDSGIAQPSIFTAVQEQIGLRLESTKRPIELVVIDSIARPTEN